MLADLIETWTTEPSKRKWIMTYLPIILSVALVCLLAWQLANLYWAINAPPAIDDVKPVALNNNTQQKSPSADINKITSANLFGAYQAENIEPEEDLSDVVDTTLNLSLNGTLLSDISEQSRAIIEVGGDNKVFSIGEEIQNNVSLFAVEANQVILNNRGKKEALRLPRVEDIASTAPRRAQTNKPTSRAANRIATDLRNSALKNPSSITDILRLKKGQTSTGQKGFRVYPGKKRERFKELGLKPGDFVTQVNGLSVGDQNPFQVIQTLGTSTFINLSIERNGQPMNLSFDIGQTQ